LRLLDRLRQLTESAGHGRSVIELLILSAQAYRASGDHTQALQVLGRALELAEPEGYIRIFVDEDLHALLVECRVLLEKDRGRLLSYVDRLLQAFPHSAPVNRQPALLSERELEVLRLIAAGQSNEEIAAQLIISLGTVKAHTSNIYRKLDARGRAQAIVKARELNLL
jgi:LuxR family maltose regulon positive regulatory protein